MALAPDLLCLIFYFTILGNAYLPNHVLRPVSENGGLYLMDMDRKG
jgi:hypothetical protein